MAHQIYITCTKPITEPILKDALEVCGAKSLKYTWLNSTPNFDGMAHLFAFKIKKTKVEMLLGKYGIWNEATQTNDKPILRKHLYDKILINGVDLVFANKIIEVDEKISAAVTATRQTIERLLLLPTQIKTFLDALAVACYTTFEIELSA